MIKLMEWLLAIGLVFAVWLSVILGKVENNFTKQNMQLILFSPIIFVVMFGFYAVAVVMYRVFTFNDCEEAASELKKEIKMAKDDLKSKGFAF